MHNEGDYRDNEIVAIKQRKLLEMQRSAASKSAMNSISRPVTLTDTNFKDVVSRYPLMLIDFWADWCGPCRIVAPVIEQLAIEFTGRLVIGKLNIDENQDIARSFGIQSIPTMMILKDSKIVDVLIGALPKAQIEAKLKQHM